MGFITDLQRENEALKQRVKDLEGAFDALFYDGNELVTWSDCVWQPKKIELGV